MEILKLKGLVLKKKDIGESDIVSTIFTKKLGKINIYTYGVRKSKKRDIVCFNPFSIAEYTLTKKGEYYVANDGYLIKNFKNITKNIEILEISLYILDSINKIYESDYINNDFYDKVVEILEYVNELEILKKGYKYYLILSFLRRIMIEEGIFDIEELKKYMKNDLYIQYRNITQINKNYKNENILNVQEQYEKYKLILKKIVYVFEKYINENLQIKLEIKKFIMEDLYNV